MTHFRTFLRVLFFACATLFAGTALGQQEGGRTVIKLINADRGVPLKGTPGAQKLLGNIKLKYKDVIMTCDSAYRFKNGDFDAFSRVHINQADTLHIYGDRLFVEADTKLAKLRKNIRMVDSDMTLTTDVLNYDMDKEEASYFDGGTLRSKENDNVLVSREGFYTANNKSMLFRKDVVLTNPEYTVNSDTLRYQTQSEIAYFYGPTTIVSDETEIYCENGWYDTKTEICQFNKKARIHSETNILKGDSIYYNGSTGFGEVFENVSIRDTTNNFLILGNYGKYDEKNDESLVTDQAELIQAFDKDSLFLHADTLFSYRDSLKKNIILAYHNVRFYKPDLQGKCDSLTYSEGDSLLVMFNTPMLWSSDNQISGERIDLKMKDGEVHQMYVDEAGLIISEAIAERYNQIKGRSITGYFRDNQLYEMLVVGNGQTLYFPVEEEKESGSKSLLGMFRQDCSEIRILIDSSEIKKVTWIEQPSGGFYPNSKIAQDELTLDGFVWNASVRPMNRQDIFREPKVEKTVETSDREEAKEK
jgi:lipopolysaccharide export system protein LptA